MGAELVPVRDVLGAASGDLWLPIPVGGAEFGAEDTPSIPLLDDPEVSESMEEEELP